MDEVVSIHKSDMPEERKMKKIQEVYQQYMENNPDAVEVLQVEMKRFYRYPDNYPDFTKITEDKVIKFMELQREAYSLFDPKYEEAPAVIKKENKEKD